MNRETFDAAMEDVYSIFCRRVPGPRQLEIIYRQVECMPPDFMKFVVRYFENAANLPRNMGHFLSGELWSAYLERNPDMKSHEVERCNNCISDFPGWRKVYEQEKTGWGDVVWKPVIVRCACGNAPNPRHEPVYTDFELEAKGYALKCPFHWDNNYMPECLRSAINASEEKRPAHEECIERQEYGDW